MKGFWLGDEPFERGVRLDMARRELDGEGRTQMDQSGTVDNATWIQRGQAHYLLYEGEWGDGDHNGSQATQGAGSPSADHEVGEARTIWKLEPSQVTLIRHGFVRWTLRFVPNQTTVTTGYIGINPVMVEVHTHELSMDMDEHGGRVSLAWESVFADVKQRVVLQIRIRT